MALALAPFQSQFNLRARQKGEMLKLSLCLYEQKLTS